MKTVPSSNQNSEILEKMKKYTRKLWRITAMLNNCAIPIYLECWNLSIERKKYKQKRNMKRLVYEEILNQLGSFTCENKLLEKKVWLQWREISVAHYFP